MLFPTTSVGQTYCLSTAFPPIWVTHIIIKSMKHAFTCLREVGRGAREAAEEEKAGRVAGVGVHGHI